ncbi:MAG TPA: cupredoxin domain-containing protein [Vitreimonas sp.]|nr:cupredoxin domain-containing protein [Vitreimonas sp.]
MRPSRPAAILIVALVVVAAACGSASGPGWTYAPAPSITPPPSPGGPGESPAASPGESPGESPTGTQEPSPDVTTVTVVAETAERWETPELTTPADTPFDLEFDNRDPAAPHNVVIQESDGSKVEMGDTAFFTGPEVRTYQVPALAAGEYEFICEVHPATMVGTLTVE